MAIQNAINLTDTGIISADGAGVFTGRTITGQTDYLTVTNGDGTAGNPTVTVTNGFDTTGKQSWQGAILESAAVSAASDGATITFSVEKSGGGNLTVVFSDGYYAWTTAPATVSLTPGTDTVPVENFVYFLQSTKTLTASTVGWPATEHAPLATVVCESAATFAGDTAYKFHAWTDHVVGSDNMGHIADLNFWIRQQDATWKSGVAQTFTITPNGGAADNVILTTAAGIILQLHDHTFPAFGGTPDVYVINDSATAYTKITDLNAALTDSTGASMSGKYFSLVIWGIVSEDTGDCKLFLNLPGGSYNSSSNVTADPSKYANFTIPGAYKGTGFLIAQWNLRHQAASSGTWTSIDEIDLLGFIPNTVAGGTTAATSEFVDTAFRILDDGDNTKEIAFEASTISASTTRTITIPDKDVNLATATTTNEGIVSELCTDAEAIAKTDTARVITASNLAALTPSETVTGLAEIVTQAEVVTGTDDVRYMTALKHVTSLASPPAIGLTASAASAFTTVGVGTTTVPHGSVGYASVALEGPDSNSAGPHMQFTTATNDYPLIQILPWSHDDVSIYFDSYRDAGGQKSSSSNGNFRLSKGSNAITIAADTGIAAGSAATFENILSITADGLLTLPKQACFLVTPGSDQDNATGDGTNFTVLYSSEIKDQNSDFSSGTYTCPVTAIHSFNYNVGMHDLGAANTKGSTSIVTSNRTYRISAINTAAIRRATTDDLILTGSTLADMDAADTATTTIVIENGTKIIDIEAATTFFSGGIYA